MSLFPRASRWCLLFRTILIYRKWDIGRASGKRTSREHLLYYKNEGSHNVGIRYDERMRMAFLGLKKHVLVNPKKLRQLEQVYRGSLTDKSQVTKVARLAAQEAALLMADDIPPVMKEALVKPLSHKVRKWTQTE